MSSTETLTRRSVKQDSEHFEVLIVGAGISGIGSAYHLQVQCPGKSYLILENQESFGGTWLTHKYPGIRSDSDLFTFGYRFKPWIGAPIASAAEILTYLEEVIEENHIDRNIRYGHKIMKASWSSAENLWTVEAVRGETGETVKFTANFLWMCQGYYRHECGYTPEWEGMGDFKGKIVHPQEWPEDLDYKGKKVVVIGSGATAATVVPAMASDCEHISILQRSPTYFFPAPNENELVNRLRSLELEETWIHEIARRQILTDRIELNRRCVEESEAVKDELIDMVRQQLGPDYDIKKHFTPRYRPWRQRVAAIPDGDLFKGIVSGKASMVTDEIVRFTENGIALESGEQLVADIIVTATGFDLCVLGDIDFSIDGKPLDFGETVTYRGMMFTGVPNMAWVFGYFRASWTLRVDLLGDFVCRMLNHMNERGANKISVALRPEDHNMELSSWMDPEDFNPGYLLRNMHLLPKRGDKPEWQHTQDYWSEKDDLPATDLDASEFVYE